MVISKAASLGNIWKDVIVTEGQITFWSEFLSFTHVLNLQHSFSTMNGSTVLSGIVILSSLTLHSINGAVVHWLSQSDFVNGTYRIRAPGIYRLTEDIDFEPRPDNDHWNQLDDPNFPINQFYLGFFAAITIESNNVVVDLNGRTLQMSKKFYLLQRFFNVIEVITHEPSYCPIWLL